MNWINWLRSGSQLLAGIKVAAAFLTYFGIGQFGKWLIETFYPFTRILWSDLLKWLKLPDISDIEKDALTALLFFIPLAVSSIISYLGQQNNEINDKNIRSDRFSAIIFSIIFFLLICGALLRNIVGLN